jgi:hypothetical protein
LSNSIERVRKGLVEAERQRKAAEVSRRLAEQANEIAEIINEDFHHFSQEIAKVKAQAAGAHDYYGNVELDKQSPDGDLLILGNDTTGTIISEAGASGTGDGVASGGETPRSLEPVLRESQNGDQRGDVAAERKKRTRRGGFQIEFRNMGSDTYRARYVSDERTIFINLDHIQLEKALNGRTAEDPVFRRLAYEVAFTEYAIALSSELAAQGAYLDPFDPIADIRETIQRIADRAAYLYAD